MVAAALLEEQLQNSLATSEEDAEFEEDDDLAADLMADNADAYAVSIQLQNGMAEAINDEEGDEDEDEDAMEDEEAILSDEDAEGEEDDDLADPASHNGEVDEDEEEASDEDDDEEGVGAVKIQPGLLEDDEDVASASEEEESAASIEDDDESKDSTDAEVEEQWQQAAEEEEDEEEPVNPNRCMYVSSYTCTDPPNTFPDSANRMKKMIPAKSLSSTWPVVSVVTMVGLLIDIYLYEADEAVAHRQCARSADALKPDDGKYSDSTE
jgi:histone acetyltransferase SAS3